MRTVIRAVIFMKTKALLVVLMLLAGFATSCSSKVGVIDDARVGWEPDIGSNSGEVTSKFGDPGVRIQFKKQGIPTELLIYFFGAQTSRQNTGHKLFYFEDGGYSRSMSFLNTKDAAPYIFVAGMFTSPDIESTGIIDAYPKDSDTLAIVLGNQGNNSNPKKAREYFDSIGGMKGVKELFIENGIYESIKATCDMIHSGYMEALQTNEATVELYWEGIPFSIYAYPEHTWNIKKRSSPSRGPVRTKEFVRIMTVDNRARLCPLPNCGTGEELLRLRTGASYPVLSQKSVSYPGGYSVTWYSVRASGKVGWVSEHDVEVLSD